MSPTLFPTSDSIPTALAQAHSITLALLALVFWRAGRGSVEACFMLSCLSALSVPLLSSMLLLSASKLMRFSDAVGRLA